MQQKFFLPCKKTPSFDYGNNNIFLEGEGGEEGMMKGII